MKPLIPVHFIFSLRKPNGLFLPLFGNKNFSPFPSKVASSATKIKVQKVKLPVTPVDAGFQIVSQIPINLTCRARNAFRLKHFSTCLELIRFFTEDNASSQFALEGEECFQIETLSTRLELIRSFTGDNASSQFAPVVNLARQSSFRAKYSTRRALV
ncbi:hypothetical protein CEXT_241781 [Caerostris extrusa]|uniref:Uncharacterized protein n=1 Tax=Caerostris extrusa TaxID=172846 RepID=A0AAV4SJ14_CAEEX|nr:hypothetical protein CEXT_241781 [Caerostris extrusa]